MEIHLPDWTLGYYKGTEQGSCFVDLELCKLMVDFEAVSAREDLTSFLEAEFKIVAGDK